MWEQQEGSFGLFYFVSMFFRPGAPLQGTDQGSDHLCHFHQVVLGIFKDLFGEPGAVQRDCRQYHALPDRAFRHFQVINELALVS